MHGSDGIAGFFQGLGVRGLCRSTRFQVKKEEKTGSKNCSVSPYYHYQAGHRIKGKVRRQDVGWGLRFKFQRKKPNV